MRRWPSAWWTRWSPEDALWDVARAAAADVARAAPLAVAGTRAVVRELVEGAPPSLVEETAAGWRARAFGSDDFREGLAAFRERRPPQLSRRVRRPLRPLRRGAHHRP